MAQTLRGRFAPSPTGLAHLGNAWSFLLAWLAARQAGGEILLRMEDLDLERCSPVYMQLLMSDMRWLGLDWDEGPTPERELAAYHQSNRFPLYEEALQMLVSRGLAYPCFCSRKDVRSMASAPHVGDAGAAYPGTCRGLHPAEAARRIAKGERFSWRFRSTDRVYRFADGLYGLQERALADCGGDFSLRRSDGVFSYQLAVSVDDALMGVTQVVRGRDILPSTPRQLALLDALGLEAPSYVHIPLLLDAEGERLAKRHASLSLRSLRDLGVSPWRVVGLLARAAGLCDRLEEVHPRDLVHSFQISTMPPADYKLSDNDMAWLTGRGEERGKHH